MPNILLFTYEPELLPEFEYKLFPLAQWRNILSEILTARYT